MNLKGRLCKSDLIIVSGWFISLHNQNLNEDILGNLSATDELTLIAQVVFAVYLPEQRTYKLVNEQFFLRYSTGL